MKKYFLSCIAYLLFFIFVANSAPVPNWHLVAGGDPVAQPIETDFGFAMLLDGRTMAAVSSSGVLMWLASIPGGRVSPFLGVGQEGFTITVSGGKNLSLFNPSGLCLWTVEAPKEIISPPLQGLDGRIFVQCAEEISCFGINGTKKWTTTAGASAGFPLLQLEDGSILHIQNKTIAGCSTALRISPFGTILEEITFTGKVSYATDSPNGVILFFTDGSLGCCSAGKDEAFSRWVIPSSTLCTSTSTKILVNETTNMGVVVAASAGKSQVVFFDSSKGEIIDRQTVSIDGNNITFMTMDHDAVVLCDKSTAGSYSAKNGTLWEAPIPSEKRWSYLLYIDSGYLLVFEKNTWVTSAYRMTQKIGTKKITSQKNINNSYQLFMNKTAEKYNLNKAAIDLFGTAISEPMLKTMKTQLPEGNYGEQEALWLTSVALETTQIANRMMKNKDYFSSGTSQVENNLAYYQQVLLLTSDFESAALNRTIGSIIKQEKDVSILIAALNAAADIAYDPNNVLLSSIEYILKKQAILSNSRVSEAMCDAIYEICRFMGKPALFSKGREILSHMLNQSIDTRAKAYAALTMEKIIALQM